MTKRQRFHLLVTALAATILTPLFALADEPVYQPFPKSWQERLDKFTTGKDGTVQTARTPCVTMIVDSPKWGKLFGSSGLANIEAKLPPKPNMHFRVGSVTKMFTAQTVLALEQAGKLRLTDTVDKYLTGDLALDEAYMPDKMTVGQCLQMTAGQGSYLSAPYFKEIPYKNAPTINEVPQILMKQNNVLASQGEAPLYQLDTYYANPFKIFATLYQGKRVRPRQVQKPGADSAPFLPPYQWCIYSNSCYLTLGIVIEKASGNKLADEMKHRVMDPLGLTDTWFAVDSEIREPMMRGYSRLNAQSNETISETWIDRTEIDPSYAWAAGSVVSTPDDIMAFLRGIFKTEKVLNNATKQKWLRFAPMDLIFPNMDYARGALMQDQQKFGMLRGHGGSIPGFNNLAYYMPDSDTFFSIVVNTWDGHQVNGKRVPNEVAVMESIMPLLGDAAAAVDPPQGATTQTGKSSSINFKWQAGEIYGISYDFFLGTKRNEVANATEPTKRSTDTSVEVDGIKPGTYYWRVDTVSGGPTITGAVWEFKVVKESPKYEAPTSPTSK